RERYQEALTAAERAVAEGAGFERVIEITRRERAGRPATIRQLGLPWLRWWGGSSDTDLGELLRATTIPILICGADEPWSTEIRSKALASPDLRIDPIADNQAIAGLIATWIEEIAGASAAGS